MGKVLATWLNNELMTVSSRGSFVLGCFLTLLNEDQKGETWKRGKVILLFPAVE